MGRISLENSTVYILASERSGTNLLQRLISNHSRFGGPKSSFIINAFFYQLRYYSKLNERILFEDVLNFCNQALADWKMDADYQDFVKEGGSGFLDIVNYLYKKKMQEIGKVRLISKELNTHHYMGELLLKDPGAKFIHLVRDPREQVASQLKSPQKLRDAYTAINHWIRIQSEIINKQILHKDKVLTIRYEDIVTDTKKTIDSIFAFLNEIPEPACYQNQTHDSEKMKSTEIWDALSRPLGNRFDKHKEILHEEEIRLIEHLAAEEMRIFNYTPYTTGKWKNSIGFRIRNKYYKRQVIKRLNFKGSDVFNSRREFARNIFEQRKKEFLKTL